MKDFFYDNTTLQVRCLLGSVNYADYGVLGISKFAQICSTIQIAHFKGCIKS